MDTQWLSHQLNSPFVMVARFCLRVSASQSLFCLFKCTLNINLNKYCPPCQSEGRMKSHPSHFCLQERQHIILRVMTHRLQGSIVRAQLKPTCWKYSVFCNQMGIEGVGGVACIPKPATPNPRKINKWIIAHPLVELGRLTFNCTFI